MPEETPTVTPTVPVKATPTEIVVPPKKKGPPPPAATDQMTVNLAEEKEGEAIRDRLERLVKVLEGMQLSSHETRWLRQSMVILIKAFLGSETG